MRKCSDCAYRTMCAANAGAGGYLFDPEHEGEKYCPMFCASKKPMTNGDRIRAMTDEQLTAVIACPYDCDSDMCPSNGTCFDCCLNWLQQPVKEAET